MEQLYRLDLRIHSLFGQIEALRILATRVKRQSQSGTQTPGATQTLGGNHTPGGIQILAGTQTLDETQTPGGNQPPDPSQAQSQIQTNPTQIRNLERNLEQDVRKLLTLKEEIRELIAAVRQPEQRLLLELRYLNLMTWEQIAERMNYSSRQILRLHGKALAQLDEGGFEQREGLSLEAYQTRPRNLPRRVVGEEQ